MHADTFASKSASSEVMKDSNSSHGYTWQCVCVCIYLPELSITENRHIETQIHNHYMYIAVACM